jgi:hypothetical protein
MHMLALNEAQIMGLFLFATLLLATAIAYAAYLIVVKFFFKGWQSKYLKSVLFIVIWLTVILLWLVVPNL